MASSGLGGACPCAYAASAPAEARRAERVNRESVMGAPKTKSIPCDPNAVKSKLARCPGTKSLRVRGARGAGRSWENWWRRGVAFLPYYRNHRNMKKADPAVVTRSALRFSALGAEPRLQILRLLLAAHPEGMVAGEVQEEMGIPPSTLSHHLEKRKQEGLVKQRPRRARLWV